MLKLRDYCGKILITKVGLPLKSPTSFSTAAIGCSYSSRRKQQPCFFGLYRVVEVQAPQVLPQNRWATLRYLDRLSRLVHPDHDRCFLHRTNAALPDAFYKCGNERIRYCCTPLY